VIDDELVIAADEGRELRWVIGVAGLGALVEEREGVVAERRRQRSVESARVEVGIALDDELDRVVNDLPGGWCRREAEMVPRLRGAEVKERARQEEAGGPQRRAVDAAEIADGEAGIDDVAIVSRNRKI
jgi:hypothetical protein